MMHMSDRNPILTLPIAMKKTAILAAPLVGSRVASALNRLLAMLLIAQLGYQELAAGALISSISATLLVGAWSTLFATGIVISKELGKGQPELIGQILRRAWLLGCSVWRAIGCDGAPPVCFVFSSA